MLLRGDRAPDFELPSLIGGVKQRSRLSDQFATGSVALAFYPFNWDAISAEQLVSLQLERESFSAHNTQVVAICVDSIMNTTAWEREIGPFDYSLCSDFWPHGAVSLAYGVLGDDGASERAAFIVEKNGGIAFAKRYSRDHSLSAIEILEALQTSNAP